MTPEKDWRDILSVIDTKTRVMALIALVVDGALFASLPLLPSEQRIYALLVCAGVLVVTLIGMFSIELAETKSRSAAHATPIGDRVLPKELRNNVVIFDRTGWNAHGEPAALYRTASAFKFAGRYEKAIEFYRKVLRLEADHWKARYNIGSCLLYLHQNDKAKQDFVKLIDDLCKMDWQSNTAIRELIWGAFLQLNDACDEQQRYSEGQDYVMRSLDFMPDHALAYLNLAISCKKGGNVEEAKKWYEILLEHPDKLEMLCKMDENDKKELDALLDPTPVQGAA